LIANVSEKTEAIDKRKTELSTTFDGNDLVNFAPLTKKCKRLIFSHPKSTLRVLFYANAIAFGTLDVATSGIAGYQPPKLTYRAGAASRWALPQISSFILVYLIPHVQGLWNCLSAALRAVEDYEQFEKAAKIHFCSIRLRRL